MNASERRQAIWHALCERRHLTIAYIAAQYNISWQTAQSDISVLSLSYPITTSRGYNGGIELAEWYDPKQHFLSPAQMDFLLRLCKNLQGDDAQIMKTIIAQLSAQQQSL